MWRKTNERIKWKGAENEKQRWENDGERGDEKNGGERDIGERSKGLITEKGELCLILLMNGPSVCHFNRNGD